MLRIVSVLVSELHHTPPHNFLTSPHERESTKYTLVSVHANEPLSRTVASVKLSVHTPHQVLRDAYLPSLLSSCFHCVNTESKSTLMSAPRENIILSMSSNHSGMMSLSEGPATPAGAEGPIASAADTIQRGVGVAIDAAAGGEAARAPRHEADAAGTAGETDVLTNYANAMSSSSSATTGTVLTSIGTNTVTRIPRRVQTLQDHCDELREEVSHLRLEQLKAARAGKLEAAATLKAEYAAHLQTYLDLQADVRANPQLFPNGVRLHFGIRPQPTPFGADESDNNVDLTQPMRSQSARGVLQFASAVVDTPTSSSAQVSATPAAQSMRTGVATPTTIMSVHVQTPASLTSTQSGASGLAMGAPVEREHKERESKERALNDSDDSPSARETIKNPTNVPKVPRTIDPTTPAELREYLDDLKTAFQSHRLRKDLWPSTALLGVAKNRPLRDIVLHVVETWTKTQKADWAQVADHIIGTYTCDVGPFSAAVLEYRRLRFDPAKETLADFQRRATRARVEVGAADDALAAEWWMNALPDVLTAQIQAKVASVKAVVNDWQPTTAKLYVLARQVDPNIYQQVSASPTAVTALPVTSAPPQATAAPVVNMPQAQLQLALQSILQQAMVQPSMKPISYWDAQSYTV